MSKTPRIQQTFVVPKALAGEHLDRALVALSGDLTRSQAQRAVRRGDVLVDGRRVVRSNGGVNKGSTLRIERNAPLPTVLHEDERVVVVQKPAGWITHRADRSNAPDLAAWMDGRFGPLPTSRGEERPGVVHRLDRETSGVLVFARDEEALALLQDQFRGRSVTKRYLALVSGTPREVTLDAPIGPVAGTLDRQGVDDVNGKPARTDVRVVAAAERHALVECTIHTGRRHQIRVHLAEAGWPVLGEPLYGTKKQVPMPKGVAPAPRLALHAAHLAFDHPGTGERLAFDAPLPSDLRATAEALGLAPK